MRKMMLAFYFMHPEIKLQFQKLKTQTHILLNDVKRLNEAQYNRAVGGKWSVAQILIHLLSAEKLALGYMQKKSLAINNLENIGWLESAKTFALIISQHLPLKYKAPRVVIENTPASPPFHTLEEEWTAHHKTLEIFLEIQADSYPQKDF